MTMVLYFCGILPQIDTAKLWENISQTSWGNVLWNLIHSLHNPQGHKGHNKTQERRRPEDMMSKCQVGLENPLDGRKNFSGKIRGPRVWLLILTNVIWLHMVWALGDCYRNIVERVLGPNTLLDCTYIAYVSIDIVASELFILCLTIKYGAGAIVQQSGCLLLWQSTWAQFPAST